MRDECEKMERELAQLSEWQAGVIARAEKAESELAGIRALADRRNKSDHSQDTTHQLVAALDQALDIAQAELAACKESLHLANGTANLALVHRDAAEAELATERARLDYVMRVRYATNRAAIDAAMKEETK